MDARAAAVFFVLIVVFQGNPSCALESCVFNSARLATCVLPVCKLSCLVDAKVRHAKYKDGWCDGFINAVCFCRLCHHS
uniref:Knottin scorpion toxin-like domain-containing protein n=1 Tax=Oryza brachyantha TaxID=4533 RepID=J3N1W1_ORYBR